MNLNRFILICVNWTVSFLLWSVNLQHGDERALWTARQQAGKPSREIIKPPNTIWIQNQFAFHFWVSFLEDFKHLWRRLSGTKLKLL